MNQPQQRICNKCFTPLEPEARFCAECGTPAPMRVMGKCPNCGQEIMEGQQACYSCGALITQVVVEQQPQPQRKQKKPLSTGAWMSILAVLLVAIIAVALALLLQPQQAESVELRRSEVEMLPGERMELRWEVLPENTSDKSVKWKSSNENVATVKNGEVVAQDVGICQITVTTVNGRSDSITVTVSEHPVEKLELSETEVSLNVKDKLELTCQVLPQEAESVITWASSNEAVVEVDHGQLKAVGLGSCVITVTAENGVSAQCKVTVTTRPEERLPLGQWELIRIENRFENEEYNATGKTLVLREDLTGTLTDGDENAGFTWCFAGGRYTYDVFNMEACEQIVYEELDGILVVYMTDENWVFAPPEN